MSCACGDVFRIEALDLRTGKIKGILHPISLDWETPLNDVGSGSMTLATKDTDINLIYPGLSAIAISRVAGPGASEEDPYCEWIGYIEAFTASSGNTLQVGLKHITGYLHRRHLTHDLYMPEGSPSIAQTALGAFYVSNAFLDEDDNEVGIPLQAIAGPSTRNTRRTYRLYEKKNIGEALVELSEVENGVDWNYIYQRNFPAQGYFNTIINIQDEIGSDYGVILKSNREGIDYNLSVDIANFANHVTAIGEGEEEAAKTSTITSDFSAFPRFDAVQSATDVKLQDTLNSHAQGYYSTYSNPIAKPSIAIVGLDPDPRLTQIGDRLTIENDFGALTYKGKARIISTSWSIGVDEPIARSFEFMPLSESETVFIPEDEAETKFRAVSGSGNTTEIVLSQKPTDDCETC